MEKNSDLIVSFMENQISQYHLLKTLHFLTALYGYLYDKSSSTYIIDDYLSFSSSLFCWSMHVSVFQFHNILIAIAL